MQPSLPLPSPAQCETAWPALAELFVGRQWQPYDEADVARRLAATGLTVAQLEAILDADVAPVFRHNLGALAVPELEGWADAVVIERVREHVAARARAGALTRWLHHRGAARPELVQTRWDLVKARLAAP